MVILSKFLSFFLFFKAQDVNTHREKISAMVESMKGVVASIGSVIDSLDQLKYCFDQYSCSVSKDSAPENTLCSLLLLLPLSNIATTHFFLLSLSLFSPL